MRWGQSGSGYFAASKPWTPVDARCRLVPPAAGKKPLNYRDFRLQRGRIPYPCPSRNAHGFSLALRPGTPWPCQAMFPKWRSSTRSGQTQLVVLELDVCPSSSRRPCGLARTSPTAGDRLDILQVAPHHLRKLVDRAWAAGSNRTKKRESVRSEEVPRGLDTGEVDTFASIDPPARLDGFEGVAEPGESLTRDLIWIVSVLAIYRLP